jgi:hypothetical protein
MGTTVNASPEDVLTRLEAWFLREWKFGGAFSRPTGGCLTHPPANSRRPSGRGSESCFDSFGGWMVFLILWLLTAGAFWILYLLWLLIRTEVSSGPAYAATIIATPERDGRTRVTIQANRDDWQEALDSWLTREFPEAV